MFLKHCLWNPEKKTWVLLAFHIVMLNMTVCRATPIEPIHRRLGEKIRIRAIEGPRERERRYPSLL